MGTYFENNLLKIVRGVGCITQTPYHKVQRPTQLLSSKDILSVIFIIITV